MDLWTIQIPIPLALAVVATMGYLIGHRRRETDRDLAVESQRELRRAQSVAKELERISFGVRKSLAKHHSSIAKFKDRVGRLSSQQREAAWKELCREAEEILQPTLQLASQISNAYDEIRQQSAHLMTFTEVRTDPLTGVYNRRGLDDSLGAQFALATRYGSTFSLALFDIDHFKRVNDERGHLQGDRILQDLAKLFDEYVRESDVVARYGGEEFVVVMPQTDLEGACAFSDRLRAEVERRMYVTVSGGVASVLEGDEQDSFLGRADAALYAAKEAGRNCVFRHTGVRPEPVAAEVAAESA